MKRLGLTLAMVAAAATASASEVDRGFYVGAGIGRSSLSAEDFYTGDAFFRFEDDDFGYKVFGGYRFFDFLAVEAGIVDPGNLSVSEQLSEFGDVSLRTTLDCYDAFVVGLLPAGSVEFYAKLGVVAWDADTTLTIDDESTDLSDSGTDAAYGLGIGIRTGDITLRIEGERFDFGEADGIDMFTFAVTYTF